MGLQYSQCILHAVGNCHRFTLSVFAPIFGLNQTTWPMKCQHEVPLCNRSAIIAELTLA
jgi:hypothetical protein